jgi:hypothetical protein
VTLWLPLIAVGQTDDPPAAAQQMLPGNPSAGSPSCAGAAALPVPA